MIKLCITNFKVNNRQIIDKSERISSRALINAPQDISSICLSRFISTQKLLIKNGEVTFSGKLNFLKVRVCQTVTLGGSKLCVAITSSYDMQKCAAGLISPNRRRRNGRGMSRDGSWNYLFVDIIGIDGEMKSRTDAFRKNQYHERCFENFDLTQDRLRIWDYSYTRDVSRTVYSTCAFRNSLLMNFKLCVSDIQVNGHQLVGDQSSQSYMIFDDKFDSLNIQEIIIQKENDCLTAQLNGENFSVLLKKSFLTWII